MRIFPTLAPIVVMLKTVIYDLRIFMLFYMILICMFCQVFAVLGLGNNIYIQSSDRLLKGKGKGGGSGGGRPEGDDDFLDQIAIQDSHPGA